MASKKTENPNLVSVSVKRSTLDDKGLENLVAIVRSKESLIQKAFATGPLRIEATKDRITFHWFVAERPEDMNAYSVFIEKLCDMAKTLKRVNARGEKSCDNEKYAFRCFLLRLGLIGDQYKETRKVLLRNLSGSAAFKSGARRQEAAV